MEITGEGLDEVLIDLYGRLLRSTSRNKGSRGDTIELLSVALHIAKPRARLSRSENRGHPFSALGELLWYLSGSDSLDFIEPYVRRYRDDAVDGKLQGAYGPRLFRMRGKLNQISNVIELLLNRPTSRRAVIQLFNAEDIATEHKEIPCTTTLQFHLREGRLHMSVTLRSNDAYWGLPHDVFCFTMLQEMMARRLGAELGEYYQYVGSMHVYEDYLEPMQQYVIEGHQKTIEMPSMPAGNPFDFIGALLNVEQQIRHGKKIIAADIFSEPYWADIIRLLQVFWATGHPAQLDELAHEFASPIYKSYLDARRGMKSRVIDSRAETQGG